MRYTTLKVVEQGVVLGEHHLRRLAPPGPEGELVRQAFARFARTATPGIYSLTVLGGPEADAGELLVKPRPASSLFEGMPVRYAPSPFGGQGPPGALPAAFPKPAPPSPYDPLRLAGVATLLTSADGEELYESCCAALVAWDGRGLLLPPQDRPRVASLAEAALVEAAARGDGPPAQRRPLLRRGGEPLLLANAVKGVCTITCPDRPPFPAGVRALLQRLLLDECLMR